MQHGVCMQTVRAPTAPMSINQEAGSSLFKAELRRLNPPTSHACTSWYHRHIQDTSATALAVCCS